jgi:CheY-like chemotaxis protein
LIRLEELPRIVRMSEAARVLVVDDNETNRDMLSRRLKRRGYSVDVAQDGEAALVAIGRDTFDIILLDVMMPRLSGYEVLDRIRTSYSLSELPVIMATSRDRSEDVVHALRQGANDYITKPIDFDVLVARIETHLAMKRQAESRSSPAPDASRRVAPPYGGNTTVAPQFGRIGRYEIVQPLGEGGMGAVFLARDPSLGRLVAIKLIREGADDPERRERFAREARSAAQLAHPSIVTIYDIGEHGGQPYMAMEFVPGETLAAVIARGEDRPLASKLNVIDHLCAGLAHAHRAGIVHRDVKPANVMITPEGSVKILDFGIARLSESHVTRTGMVLGTLNYMAPEQLSGERADNRTDIFALGAVCYELLSHKQAFPGTVRDGLLKRILLSAPTPLQQLCPQLDKELVSAVEQALDKEPGRRQADVDHLRLVVKRVNERILARPWSAPMRIE